MNVLYGSESNGITRRDDFWSQGSRGIKGIPEAFDNFGLAVAAGDFDGDRRWDLVAASPRDSVQGFGEAGAVNVIYGHRGGVREDPDELWTQGTRGIKGAVGDDRFGAAVGSGAPGRSCAPARFRRTQRARGDRPSCRPESRASCPTSASGWGRGVPVRPRSAGGTR